MTDDKYGFVKNPQTKKRKGRTYVGVKFDRQELIEKLETGTQELYASGIVDGRTVYGSDEVSVKSPGK